MTAIDKSASFVTAPSIGTSAADTAATPAKKGDLALDALRKGGSIKIVMTVDLDNAQYTGDRNGVGDAAGTILLAKGTEYTVRHDASTGAWVTAGYNEGLGRHTDGEKYKHFENLLPQGMINMWGRGMIVKSNGDIYDQEYGKVGRLVAINGSVVAGGDSARSTDRTSASPVASPATPLVTGLPPLSMSLSLAANRVNLLA